MRTCSNGTSIYVSVSILAQMFSYLASLQIDVEALLTSLGIDETVLKKPDERIPLEYFARIESEAERIVGDPCFGLHMGEFVEAGSWSVLGYMMMNCRNLGEAIEKSAKYCRVIGNLIEGRSSLQKGMVRVVLVAPSGAPIPSRHSFDCTLSSLITMMRNLTGANITPLQVGFSYPEPEPESRREYERIFRCPLVFGEAETSITMDTALSKTPILYANAGLLERIEGYAREFLSGLDERDYATHATSSVVARLILAKLAEDSLSIRSVARDMAMSVRTLQNRLEEDGIRFGELVSDLRLSQAKKYLHENFSVEEITCLLGFSEPSVFRKAFKKWTGMTPGDYRKAVRQEMDRPAIFGALSN